MIISRTQLTLVQKFSTVLIGMSLAGHLAFGQVEKTNWKIVENKTEQRIDIYAGSQWMTSYCYYDSIRKPILFPINTFSGITVTRGFPIAPRTGERADHPHHTGLWLNYEYVNGLDFWNNSTAIPPKERIRYGTIRHKNVISFRTNSGKAELKVDADWITPGGKVLIEEQTTYIFQKRADHFVIDRLTTLTAGASDVSFKDTKDGFLGLRVASELEMPSKEPVKLVDIHGNITEVEASTEHATGLYESSDGLTGDAVWGTRGRWCVLTGTKEGGAVSIAIIDHPKNIGYPTYWHARGYGLFAANPLGQEIFSKGKEKLNFILLANQSVVFRFRIVVTSGKKITTAQVNELADEFADRF